MWQCVILCVSVCFRVLHYVCACVYRAEFQQQLMMKGRWDDFKGLEQGDVCFTPINCELNLLSLYELISKQLLIYTCSSYGQHHHSFGVVLLVTWQILVQYSLSFSSAFVSIKIKASKCNTVLTS